MKTKIVPVNRGSYYALEERSFTENKTDPNDNQLVRIVAHGFVPYLMWRMEQRPALKSLFMATNKGVTPTKEELFSSYFDFMFLSFDIQPDLPYRPTDEELKSMFRPIHASKELEEFAALPDDLKQEHRGIFNEYMSWINPSLDQAGEERKLSRRAQAIYIILLDHAGKGNYKGEKMKVKGFASQEWGLTEGEAQSVYNALHPIQYDKLDEIKKDYPQDYDVALSLFNKDFPEQKPPSN